MEGHRRRRLTLAVLTLVAVTLVATAAAPMFSLDQGGENRPAEYRGAPEDPASLGPNIDLPASSIVLAVIVVGLVGLVVQFARDPRATFVGLLKMAVVGGVFAGIMLLVAENVTLSPFSAEGEYNGSVGNVSLTAAPTPTDAGYGSGATDPLAVPVSGAMSVVLAGAVVGVLTLLVWRSGAVQSALGSPDDGETDGSDDALEGVGQVAREAADRVDAAATATAADNAIYRAWRDMVDLLDVPDPQAETPRQFARAATEAGMDPDDVSLLTRTFEEVRYGDATLSDERRDRVTEAFRRIERSVGDQPGDDADTRTDRTVDDGSEGTE